MKRNQLTSLLVSLTIFSNTFSAAAQQSLSGDVNLVGVGLSVLNLLLNPPHRAREIEADTEIKKARIAAQVEIEKEKLRIAANADKITPILERWGVSRVICSPGAVFINDIGDNNNTICVQPNSAIAPGYYSYDNRRGLLFRIGNQVSQAERPNYPSTKKMIGNMTGKGF